MMTASKTGSPVSESDYIDAQNHLHLGQWAEAIALLESLSTRYPKNANLAGLLNEARFKAGLDNNSRVRAKRWVLPWRPWATRLGFVLTLALIIWVGLFVVRSRIGPLLAAAQERQAHAQLLADATTCMEAGDLACVEEKLKLLQDMNPDEAQIPILSAWLTEEQALLARYEEAVALLETNNCAEALPILGELQVQRSNYRDVSARIGTCTHSIDVAQVLKDADGYYALMLHESALDLYEQVHAQDVSYQTDHVTQRMVDLHLILGRTILGQGRVPLETVRAALAHFKDGLQLQPRNAELALERDMAQGYLSGQEAHAQGEWTLAVNTLQPVYNERPDYIGGVVPPLLYDAYIGRGDALRLDDDCTLAYEQYRQAAALPVADTTAANARLEQVTACLTPTPTVTPTAPPTSTPLPGPTATPTPVPQPLKSFRNKIVFKSYNEEQPGFWAMDATGGNREFIGGMSDSSLSQQFEELLIEYRQSPDGKSYVYVDKIDGRPQIVIAHNEGAWPTRPLTRMTGMAYDPSWAPDGSRVVFVTQENESDDIWVIEPDSSGQRALMRNDWEWDKHPSWSPDSTRIVFMSNRWGAKQIFTIDANGQKVRNISDVPWDEDEPIWIR